MPDNLFQLYFKYIGLSEAPLTFHRWSLIGVLSALLARSISIPFGHSQIYPNQYVILTGGPGSRKGTAIRAAIQLIRGTGYDHFAPNRAAKEALWAKMAKAYHKALAEDETLLLSQGLVDDLGILSEMFIAQDEFIDFVGVGNDELVINLTNLWDNLDKFDNPRTTKSDIAIPNPTINILSGSAPGLISAAFSGLALSGGFFSRVIFVYGGYTSAKVTWPAMPDPALGKELTARLSLIRNLKGTLKLSQPVRDFLDSLYKGFPGVPDRRFNYYGQRRFTHLLKLLLVCTASRGSLDCTVEDCLLANTVLHLAELRMPHALGEYGKSRHSDVANTIMDIIKDSDRPIGVKDLWKQISKDLDKMETLAELLANLMAAGRVQQVRDKSGGPGRLVGYLPVLEVSTGWAEEFLDYSLVEPSEHPAALVDSTGVWDNYLDDDTTL